MEHNGIYLRYLYLAPRKRKTVAVGFTAATLEECDEIAYKWLKEKGGKFVSGYYTPCRRWLSHMEDGREIWMQSIPLGITGEPVNPKVTA